MTNKPQYSVHLISIHAAKGGTVKVTPEAGFEPGLARGGLFYCVPFSAGIVPDL